MTKLDISRQAVILRGPPAIGKSGLAAHLIEQFPVGTACTIDFDHGWNPQDWRYKGGGKSGSYTDLKRPEDILLIELGSGEPSDGTFNGPTRNPREWISILENDGREVRSFLFRCEFNEWKKRLLSKPGYTGDGTGEEPYYRLFESDDWIKFEATAKIKEVPIETTSIPKEKVFEIVRQMLGMS